MLEQSKAGTLNLQGFHEDSIKQISCQSFLFPTSLAA